MVSSNSRLSSDKEGLCENWFTFKDKPAQTGSCPGFNARIIKYFRFGKSEIDRHAQARGNLYFYHTLEEFDEQDCVYDR